MGKNKFLTSLDIGEKIEIEVINYLQGKAYNIIDVRNDIEYRKKDIDIIVTNKRGKTITVEIKSDSKIEKNDNFFFELGMDRVSGFRNGWHKYCEADIIIFVCLGFMYVIEYDKHKETINAKGKEVKFWNKTDECWGYGLVVPRSQIVHKCIKI